MTPQHLRQLADRTGLDGIAEALREAADEIDAMQARSQATQPAQVTGLLEAFDDAVSQELPRVSHVEYDSHEICKHFASKIRAILSLRPERVPMTPASRDVIMATRTANADADEWPEPWAYQRGWNDAEAHHGITAQAKTEAP